MNERPSQIHSRSLFTLTELLVACSILVIVLSALVPLALFVTTSYMRERVRNDLDTQARTAGEWIKKDITATARGDILMWPESSSTAVCMSFPVLRRGSDDDTLPVDDSGKINWNQTIIYHLSVDDDTGRTQLRRTVFDPRDNSLNATERLYQMVYTWLYGTGEEAIYNTENATTKTLLRDVSNYNVTSGPAEVDGYSPVHSREVVSMGAWTLWPGYHYLEFRLTGKNSASSNYRIGLDMLSLSATGLGYEAEHFLPPYASDGATAVSESISEYPGWSNKSQLYFPATGAGQYFTLKIHNDMWLESTFASDTAVLDRTEITYDPVQGENICQMIGNRVAWEATVQSFGGVLQDDPASHEESSVRVVINATDPVRGRSIALSGRRGAVTFTAAPGTAKLGIKTAYIMERISGYNGDPATVQQLTFNQAIGLPGVNVHSSGYSVQINGGVSAPSDLFDLAIDPAKDYIVSYNIANTAGNGNPAVWPDAGGVIHTYELQSDAANRSGDADWSGIPASSITSHPHIMGTQDIYVTYPETAVYTSEILDTRLADPAYMNVNWSEYTTATNSIQIKIRAGDQPDLSDAPAWSLAPVFTEAIGVNSLSTLPQGRYLQWQAVFQTTAPYDETAKLKRVVVLWPGERRGVDIGVAVEKDTDMGIFQLRVDGRDPSPAALSLRFTIGQAILNDRYEKAFAVRATPRNE